ncbi:MAG: transglycosylase family protein, partial [Acidimicrobiales bacterium]
GRGPSVGPSRFALLAKTAAQPPPSERVPMGTPWLRGRDEIVLHDIDAQLVVDFIDIKWRPHRPPTRPAHHANLRVTVRPSSTTTTLPPTTTTTTTITPTTTITTTVPLRIASSSPAPAGGVWYELRMCESSDNYSENSGNGYYGAYQFALSTWYGLGFSGLPSNASPGTQDLAARELQAEAGWGQWPACSAELGL